ncbi:hypothetical protein SC936_09760 [Aggregatibacter actinomycetemcomitans serotype e str. SC936]|nr:hypothetical protein SC936_09760 [Aggregatibacter actinomycetemcomitans serotype e str. SC936]
MRHFKSADQPNMAIQSKYQDKQIDEILNDMIAVLEKHQAPLDLSLIVLGNMTTNLLLGSVGKQQRQVLAKAFSDALLNSVNTANQ